MSDFAKAQRLIAAALRFAKLRLDAQESAEGAAERIAKRGPDACGDVPTRATVLAAERDFLDEAKGWL